MGAVKRVPEPVGRVQRPGQVLLVLREPNASEGAGAARGEAKRE